MKKQVFILLVLIPALLLSGCAGLFPSPAAETAAPAQAPEDLPSAQTAAAPEAEAPEAPAQEPAGPPQLDPSEEGVLRISELMTKNRATLAKGKDFPDWIELQNVSDAPLDLSGWGLSDGEGKEPWPLPEQTLEPGACALILCGSDEEDAPFSLSAEETVCLYAPSGAVAGRVICPELRSDEAFALDETGSFCTTLWPSPGYPNTDEGYAAFAASRSAAGPLVINEVITANISYPAAYGKDREDWVELKNISDSPVELSEYLLWDDDSEEPFRLPEKTLQPGAYTLIVCGSGDEGDAPFSLDAGRDRLYLGTEDALCDYVALHDLPVNGSCGRRDGQGGFFYFTAPSPERDNGEGFRMVSEAPISLTEDGVYNGIDSLSVELSAPGAIYCSTDGTLPRIDGKRCEGPISLSRTTVLRAVAVEEGKAPSRVLTLSYIINENHTLPVLSMAIDEPGLFRTVYNNGYKNVEMAGSLSLYENGRVFTQACGVKMSGSGSLKLPKKSMAIMFRGCYGDGNLNCDLFDTGISRYASLQLRAGEAYPTTIIQSDLFQDICLSFSDSALTQHSKHCVLYVDGKYYGIYCLKEKFSAQYYASLKGVSKESVTMLKYPVTPDSTFSRDLLPFCRSADMSDPENYRKLCTMLDVDSFIDWYLVEGLSGNGDIGGNLRVFSSTENGGRWSFALYDLDWGFREKDYLFENLNTDNYYHTGQVREIMTAAMKSEEFRDRILSRYAELYDTALSNDSFLRQIDVYEERLSPEIARDRQLWGGDETGWRWQMENLRNFIRDNDVQHLGVEHFCRIWHISDETRRDYFGW